MPPSNTKKIKKILIILSLLALLTPNLSLATTGICQCVFKNGNTFNRIYCKDLNNIETFNKSVLQKDCDLECSIKRKAQDISKVFGDFTAEVRTDIADCQTQVEGYNITRTLEDLKIAKPLIEINVPNLNLSEVKNTTYEDEEGNIYLQLPWIGEYIAALYRFAVIIASIFAVVMIINKGFSIVMSGGGEEKVAAYKRIGQILIGLSLVWGSYTLLYYINPSLVQFKVLSVQFIQRQDLPPEDLQPSTGSSDDNAPELSGDNNWVAIGNIPKVIAQSGQIARPDVVEALRQAAKNFPGNVNLKSAGRSAAGQYAVMVKNCGCISVNTLPQNVPTGQWSEYCTDLKPGGNGCDAGYTGLGRKDGQFTAPNISHTGGNALDLFAEGRGFVSCTGQDEKVQKSAGVNNSKKCKGTNCCVPEKQQKLIKAMLDAGFCVALKSASGLRESWHFELTGNSAINSSFCTKDLNDPNLQRLKFLQ